MQTDPSSSGAEDRVPSDQEVGSGVIAALTAALAGVVGVGAKWGTVSQQQKAHEHRLNGHSKSIDRLENCVARLDANFQHVRDELADIKQLLRTASRR